jgi:hypothetical protein
MSRAKAGGIKELTIQQGAPLIISSKLCQVYKSDIVWLLLIAEGPQHASASIVKSQYVLSLFLGTIFYILNRHQGVKNFDVYVNIFNLLHEIFSYKFRFLDCGADFIYYWIISTDLSYSRWIIRVYKSYVNHKEIKY